MAIRNNGYSECCDPGFFKEPIEKGIKIPQALTIENKVNNSLKVLQNIISQVEDLSVKISGPRPQTDCGSNQIDSLKDKIDLIDININYLQKLIYKIENELF